MCEYCGCEEIEAIADLTAEHDRLRELGRGLATAARAGDAETAGRLAIEMRAVLGPHSTVEEDGLFPVMAVEFPDQIAALTGEHRSIDAVLEELAGGRPGEDWAARGCEAVHVLFEHILKEQDGVFPASVTTLGPHDWDAIAAVRSRVGSAVLSTAV